MDKNLVNLSDVREYFDDLSMVNNWQFTDYVEDGYHKIVAQDNDGVKCIFTKEDGAIDLSDINCEFPSIDGIWCWSFDEFLAAYNIWSEMFHRIQCLVDPSAGEILDLIFKDL